MRKTEKWWKKVPLALIHISLINVYIITSPILKRKVLLQDFNLKIIKALFREKQPIPSTSAVVLLAAIITRWKVSWRLKCRVCSKDWLYVPTLALQRFTWIYLPILKVKDRNKLNYVSRNSGGVIRSQIKSQFFIVLIHSNLSKKVAQIFTPLWRNDLGVMIHHKYFKEIQIFSN